MSVRPVSPASATPTQNSAASAEVTVAVTNCLPTVPSPGCVISSRDAFLDRNDAVNMFNGNLVDAHGFSGIQTYLQGRLGLSATQRIQLLPMARFFDALESAQREIGQRHYQEALPYLQRASEIQDENFYNPTTAGQVRGLLAALLSPALQAGSALEANRNPSLPAIRDFLGSVLFLNRAEIDRFAQDGILEAPIKERIERLRSAAVTIGFRVVRQRSLALLGQRNPKTEDLVAASNVFHQLVAQAGNLRIPFDEAGIIVLIDRLNARIPAQTPPIEM